MPRHDAFFFADGEFAESIQDLHDYLKDAEPRLVLHHLQPDRNDFALWVRHVFQEEKLARRLEKCRSAAQIVEVIEEWTDERNRPKAKPVKELTRDKPLPAVESPTGGEPDVPQVIPPWKQAAHEHTFYEVAHTKEFLIGLGIGLVLALVLYQALALIL